MLGKNNGNVMSRLRRHPAEAANVPCPKVRGKLSMSPQQIAAELTRNLPNGSKNGSGRNHFAMRIEEALRTAAQEEREACALLAEEISIRFTGGGLARAADEITDAIRRRSQD